MDFAAPVGLSTIDHSDVAEALSNPFVARDRLEDASREGRSPGLCAIKMTTQSSANAIR